jgi:hypothetical protein
VAQDHRPQLRLAVVALTLSLLTAPLATSAVFAQEARLGFGGDGVFPIHSSMNSQRWFGVEVSPGTNNTLVRLALSGGVFGGPMNPSLILYDNFSNPGQTGPRADALDGVARASLGGGWTAWTIGPFTGYDFPPLPHQDWCMGNFFMGSGITFTFSVYVVDSNGAPINNWYPANYQASYSAHWDDLDVLEWYQSPALGVDPLAVTPNQLQPDNDNGAGDSTYTFRVQYANGRSTIPSNLPPRWKWARGSAAGDGRTTMVNFDRLPEAAPTDADASLVSSMSISGLQSGDYDWTMWSGDDTWMDRTGDYVAISRNKGANPAGQSYPDYEMRTQIEVLLFLDGNIQRPHFMLRENEGDNDFTDGAIYRYVIQPTDYMNFLDNLFQFRYDPPGPDTQDTWTCGIRATPVSNGYVSLPPGGHTYEFAATDDFFPPRGVPHVQVGRPGNSTRAEFWHPKPGSPYSPASHTYWEREFEYTREVRPFGYPYDSQDPNNYPNVNPVLSGFPYFDPVVVVPPYLRTNVSVARWVQTGGEPRLVPAIQFEQFNDTTKQFDYVDVVSPFESIGPQGGPQGTVVGASPTRPNQPTHYTNDDTIRPNFGNIWEEFPPSPGVPFRGGKWTQSTTFTFLVNYWRKPSRSPDFIQCRIRKNNRGSAPTAWRNFTMQQLDPSDTDYSDGAVFQFQISADQLPSGGGPGDYNYYFVASDGTRTTIFPNRPPQFTEPESGYTAEDIDVLLPASNPQSDLGVPMDLEGNNDYYWFRVNHPPVLSANDVVPSSDRMGEPFIYYVTYTDVDGEVLNANARGDEPFEASIWIDLFGDPQGEAHVAGVSGGALNYTTETGPGYAANSLVDAVRPYYVRIDEAANPAALGLLYEITGNSTTQIQATPVPPALGFGADPISAGDRIEILQWFQGKMDRVDPTDNIATDGIRYMFNTANNITLGPGLHRYYFAFRDDWGDWAYPDNPDVSVEGEPVRFPQTLEFEGPEVLENHAPILSNYRFTPDAPGTGPDGTTATGFRLSVTYTDTDNDPPAVIRVGVDGTQSAPDLVLNMTPVNPNDTVYTDGAVFETPAVRLAAGNHVFRAQASDGDLTYPVKASPSDPLLFVGKQTSAGPPPVYNDSEPGPRVAPNTPPTLEFEPNDAPPGQPSPGLDPDSGTQQTVFTYHIIYKDVDVFAGVQGNPPVWVRVFIDGQRTDMQQVDPNDTDYTDGALFEATATNLVAGTAHSYYFIGNDGSDNARQPALTAVPNKFPGPKVDEPPGPAKSLVVSDVPNDQGGSVQGSFNPSDDDGGGAGDVTEYRIYYDTDQNMTAPTLALTVAAGAGQYPFTWDKAPKTLDLFYMVRAYDGTNESVDSNVAGPVRALDNIAPAAPTNVTATNPGAGTRIDLAWAKSADDGGGANDVVEYRIYRAQTSGGYGTALATVAAGTTTYQDTTAVDGVDFYYVVRAFDGQNESVDSNEAGPVMSTDNSAPTLSNFDPMPGARDVPQDTNISFTATDTGAGVDPTSLQFEVTVGGVAVTVVKSQAAVPNGYRFTFDPEQDFNELDVVQVKLAVSDLAVPTPRTATRTYRFTIVPPPTYSVSGTITQAATGGGVQGVGGVTVYAGALSGQTDSMGQYMIVGLTNGSYEVVPKKRGKSFQPASRNVTVADADVPGVDFTAVPGYDTQGHVRDVNGPVANVRVSNGLQEAVTNARGVYLLKDSAAGTYVVRPALAGSVFKPTERVVDLPTTAPDGSAVNQDFYASPETFSIAGRVSTADGGVLTGAKVTIETRGHTPTVMGTGKTDIGGAYIVNKIPAGTYNVRPEKTGFTFEPATLEVTVGPNSINNDFVAYELFTASYVKGLSFLAIPVYPAKDDIIAALGTDRVARWDPSRAGTDKYVYAAIEPKSPILNLAPGRGYFAAFNNATNVEVAGKLVRTTDAFSLDLAQGFNMAGNPYPAALAWSNLAVAPAGPVADFGFLLVPGTRDYELVSDIPELHAQKSIPLGAGFWIESDRATTLVINPPQTASAPAAAPEAPAVNARNWVIPIVAATPVASDLSSRAGIMETNGDGIQATNPPATAGTVDLYFTGADGRKLACDVRPTTGAKTIEWTFAVWTDLKRTPVSIQLPDLSPIPPEMRVTLVDEDANRTKYARTMQAYTYDSREGGERHFRLIVEPQRGGNLAITAAGAQPTRGGVALTYTLSRQAAVTITIRNLIGREIATIVRGQDTAGGTNTAMWDLKNAQGTRVPSGSYLVVLQAASDDGQQTQALRSVTVNR